LGIETDTDADGLTKEQADSLNQSAETFDFEADVSRIMDIIINSLYANKEIFLREIISNASDALDKVKYSALKNPEYLGDEKELEIRIEFNKDEKTISVIDTGIGMTKSDLINNLGTVAKSGTTQFLELIGKTQDMSLIGQFGVGFYSSFLVSNKVTVTSKNNNDPEQHIWKSTADGKFAVNADPRGNTLKRGSRVTMHMKDDAVEFLEQDKITELVKKYSLFCNYPIYLYTHRDVTKQIEIEDEDDLYADDDFNDEDFDDEDEDDEDFELTDDDEDDEEDEGKKKKTITETVWEWELINEQKAIWLRNKNEVEEEEYNELYKGLSKDTDDPLAYSHFAAEGDIEFKSVLFIPSSVNRDTSDSSYYGKSNSLKLYVRRVLISDEFEDLMPRYLSFIKGIVDSDDLPLSVSREQLQQLKLIKVMSKKLVRKALDMMRMLAEEEEDEYDDEDDEDYDDYDDEEVKDIEEEEEYDEEEEGESKYTKFWNTFGKNIKLGVIEDAANRAKLAKLLRFYTTQSPDELTSFDEYLARMPKSQDAIYYMPGDSVDSIMKSPLIKKYEKHGIEVLLLNDPIDEFTMQHLSEYKNKKMKSIAKEDGNAFMSDSEQKKRNNIIKDMYKPLTDWWKKHLGKDVEKVAISARLVDEPAYIFTSQYGYSAHMEKINRAQAFANSEKAADYMLAKKHFEVNPHHPIMRELLDRIKVSGGDPDEATINTMDLLYNMALLNSGFVIEDPTAISDTMQQILRSELGLARTGDFEELEIDIDDEEEDDDEVIEMDLDDDLGEYETEADDIPDDL
jgi:heat shock protein beta